MRTGRPKPGSVIQHIGVARIYSHCGDEVVLRLFKLTQMEVSISALTSTSRQTAIIVSQVNRARHGIDRFFITIRQIVDNAGVVVAKIEVWLDSNYLEEIIESFITAAEMFVSQSAKAVGQSKFNNVSMFIFNRTG